ncbi:MAG TPA: radical SAM family heme chaperone HemW [Bacillota bacterium]|nr:radical SAM family heme chaperone HemW [Bacillota bacterium]
MESSLYVHIPFCIKKCLYCDFVSFPDREDMHRRYVDALLSEMALRGGKTLRTVYIGGGTPTCLEPGLLCRVLEGVDRCFDTSNCIEKTIEANPGTLSVGILETLKEGGINRLSIGLQSWHPEELKTLGRTHDRQTFVQSYKRARKLGFDNINIDLIFGIPGQTLQSWRKTLEAAADLAPEHISCYSLKIEEGTPFHSMIAGGALEEPDTDLDRDMYHYAVEYLEGRGYERYEISNFARKGRECVHNMVYWENRPYIGVGVAAHSYQDGMRMWNTPDLHRYCTLLDSGKLPVEGSEVISPETGMFETIFLRLRTRRGINFREFEQEFGTDIRKLYSEQIERLKKDGLIEMGQEGFWLTPRGIDLSNSVFVQFFIN